MKLKPIVALFASLMLCFGICGCAGNNETEQEEDSSSISSESYSYDDDDDYDYSYSYDDDEDYDYDYSSSSSGSYSTDRSMTYAQTYSDGWSYMEYDDGSAEITDGWGMVARDTDGDGELDIISTDSGESWEDFN